MSARSIIFDLIVNRFRERHFSDAAITVDSVMAGFDALPTDTIEYIALMFSDISITSEDSTLIDALALLAQQGASARVMEDISFLYVSYALVRQFFDDMMVWYKGDSPAPRASCAIEGLAQYRLTGFDYDPEVAIRRQSERTQNQCVALITMTENLEWRKLESYRQGPFMVRNTPLAQLVADHHHRLDELMDLISQRGDNADVLKDIFDSPSDALREGVL